MAALTIPGDVNYDCLIGMSASATIDTFAISNDAVLTVDTDTFYCSSHVGATTGNNGSFDTVSAGMVGRVKFDGTKAKMIPYKDGSGTTPALFLGLAISGLSYASNVVTCTTAAHGLTTGTQVFIRIGGVTPNGYNGLFHALVTGATTMVYYLASDPGAATVTNARMVRYFKVSQLTGAAKTLTAASTTGASAPYVATFTSTSHGFVAGDVVTVSGVTPAAYNGVWEVRGAPTADTFTVWLQTSPVAGTVFGTAQKNVYSSLLGFFSSFSAAPLPTGTNGAGTVPTLGWAKVKDVTGGSFAEGALVIEGGTTPAATAVGVEQPAWIEIVGPATATATIPRLGDFEITGTPYYPFHIPVTATGGSWAANVVTIVVANSFAAGTIVTVTGASPSGYNGTFVVVSATGAQFTAALLSDPGAWVSGGDCVAQICTSGVANQTVQLPAPLPFTFYPGIEVETAVGSGVYEIWPVCNIAAGVGTVAQNANQGKVVWMSTQGLARIGHDGTNQNGYTPVSGLKIRVPNVVTSLTTKVITTGAYPKITLPATVTGRYSFTTTGGGVINIDGASHNWNTTFAQPYAVNISNSMISDAIGAISEVASPMTWTNVGVGSNTPASFGAIAGYAFSLCFAGGTFANFVVAKHQATSGTTAIANTSWADCFDFTLTGHKVQLYPIRRSASSTTTTLTRCSGFRFTTFKAIGAQVSLVTCTDFRFTTSSYHDLTSGTTTSTTPCYWWTVSANTSDVRWDGLSFDAQANTNPYLGVFNPISGSNNLDIRNMGSAGSPLSLGPTNAAAYFLVGAAGAGCRNIALKRIYTSDTRSGNMNNIDNSYSGLILQNVWFDAADISTPLALNMQLKGVRATVPAAANVNQGAVYGTHFADYFPTTTTGKICIIANEKTTAEPSASSYTEDVTGSGAGFTSAGEWLGRNVGDQVTWEHPYFVIGHTAFPNTSPTMTIAGAATNNNIDLFYDIDQSAGFSGSYKNLRYHRTATGGAGAAFTMTMADTTGVAAGDYVKGTNVGTNAKVVTIDSGTQITVDVANTGTVSGVLTFNQLPNVVVTSAAVGFKLRVRAKVNTAATTNTLEMIDIPTTSSVAAQAYQYLLDTVPVELTVVDTAGNPLQNVQAAVYVNGTAVFDVDTDANGVASGEWSADSWPVSATYRLRKNSTGAQRYFNASGPLSLQETTGASATVAMRADTIASV
jgi:hypothetical protein